jgi:hypothetical protein
VLAFVSGSDRGEGDRLLSAVALRLAQAGLSLAGVVQVNTETDPSRPCLMDLKVLTDGHVIRISQALGPHASGCRLDPAGLEDAVGRVGASLALFRPDLLIVNKFGKQEGEGRGFRPLIGQAIAIGVPVLTSVAQKNRAAFDDFAGEIAAPLAMDEEQVVAWCLSHASLSLGSP